MTRRSLFALIAGIASSKPKVIYMSFSEYARQIALGNVIPTLTAEMGRLGRIKDLSQLRSMNVCDQLERMGIPRTESRSSPNLG